MFILQSFAGLTFKEAYVYLWVEKFNYSDWNLGLSRQATYSFIRKAKKKIEECEDPVEKFIQSYVESAPMVIMD